MLIKSLHTYLWRLSLGSSCTRPSLLCGGSAGSFDSAPQGNLSCTYFAAALGCQDCRKADPGFCSCPQCLLYTVTGLGRIQELRFSFCVFCLIPPLMFQGKNEVLLQNANSHGLPITQRPSHKGCCSRRSMDPSSPPDTSHLTTSPTLVLTSPV